MRVVLLVMILSVILACPALAGEDVGGVKPVTPSEFQAKIQEAGDKLYSIGGPVVDLLGKLSIAVVVVLLLLVPVIGAEILKRVFLAALVVCLGITLWYFIPTIIEWVKQTAMWFQSS